jgi:outer membrane biosynthesis protein TonB
MRLGIPLSILAHAGILAAGVLVLPHAVTQIAEPSFIPVELLNKAEIGLETNIRAKITFDTPTEEPEQTPSPQPAPQTTTPPEAVTPPEPAPLPDPRQNEANDKKEEADQKEPEPEKAEPKKPEPKKPEPPRKPPATLPAKPQEAAADPLGDLLKSLEEVGTSKAAPPRGVQADPNDDGPDRDAIGQGTGLSIAVVDALRLRLEQCWRIPADAPEPEKLIVRVRINLRADGTLAERPRILNNFQIEASGDPYWRAAADNAVRAVVRCEPYDMLPPELYAEWDETTINFGPKITAGQ